MQTQLFNQEAIVLETNPSSFQPTQAAAIVRARRLLCLDIGLYRMREVDGEQARVNVMSDENFAVGDWVRGEWHVLFETKFEKPSVKSNARKREGICAFKALATEFEDSGRPELTNRLMTMERRIKEMLSWSQSRDIWGGEHLRYINTGLRRDFGLELRRIKKKGPRHGASRSRRVELVGYQLTWNSTAEVMAKYLPSVQMWCSACKEEVPFAQWEEHQQNVHSSASEVARGIVDPHDPLMERNQRLLARLDAAEVREVTISFSLSLSLSHSLSH